MRVLLDDRPCEVEAHSIAAAVAAVAAVAERKGRLIVEVEIDGLPCEGDDLARLAERTTPADEVRLISTDARGLVDRTLADASEALERAGECQREAAILIDADRMPEAMTCLGEAVGVWTDVERAVSLSAAAAQLDLDTVAIGTGSAAAEITRLRDRLGDLARSLREQDPVGLADTLHYELPEVVDGWRELIAALRRHVEAAEETIR